MGFEGVVVGGVGRGARDGFRPKAFARLRQSFGGPLAARTAAERV